jgi:hypothetical protein
VRTTPWRYHLGVGLALAVAYVYLPAPALRAAALVVLGLTTIVASLAAPRLWQPARRLPFYLFAAGETVGFAAGAVGSSVAVSGAGGNPLAATLRLDTVAEGVEQAEQARELAGLGCRWAQGYHFSWPVAAADMARLAGRPASAAPGQPAVAALPHPA